MRIAPVAELPDVHVIEPVRHGDARGFLAEIYRDDRFAAAGIDASFVQQNLSRSARGVLRGLHFQHPHAQGKLVHALRGTVYDVAVDVRAGSPTFGRWFGMRLSADDGRAIYMPPGYAHGFAALSDGAELLYGCTDYYHAESEHVLAWDDAAVGIAWPLSEPRLSDRDRNGATLAQLADTGRLPPYRP